MNAQLIDNVLTAVSDALGRLYGLPGYVLVFWLCVLAGVILKISKRFPNDGIPLAIILLGMLVNSLIADPKADQLPLRVWIVKNVVIGGLIGGLAWLGHKNRRRIPVVKSIVAFIEEDDDAQPKPGNPS